MNKKAVEYTEKRLGTIRVIKDFLAKPENLVLKSETDPGFFPLRERVLFLAYFRLHTLP